jgi:hypothetical protein
MQTWMPDQVRHEVVGRALAKSRNVRKFLQSFFQKTTACFGAVLGVAAAAWVLPFD